ncbi:MAG: sodium-dependent transporter [Verrucomicrobiales bacterium]|nr:sodium-dependent transporter [Verrucomicrobiales bacterium]MCP5526384.1 sodium-dependent transporter [Verrucomicrobiales bacterium]
MDRRGKTENWSSRLGVIFAVSGSAVGLGNFLRFPGLAAQYGSGAFMIAYFISLILIGIPICWAEWTLGRYAGQRGYNSSPGIFHALLGRPLGKYIGVLGVVIPVVIYMYYVYIEAWCLGYAWYYVNGQMNLGGEVEAYGNFWSSYVGATENGLTFARDQNQVVLFLLIVFTLNFIIIYRGLVKGIEFFCKFAMPALIVLALVTLVRVLTLGTPDPGKPEQSLLNGLGYMWNPGDVGTQLRNPQLWLAAAGQIFFSLSVGFGVIVTYASYLSEKDDIVLSGLTASSANEFCEVALGGMITVPAAFVFLGAAGVAGQGTFALGFKVLPLVFSKMPSPWLFGSVFFFLLFLAAVTSSLSMLQPGIAFLEEGLGLGRKQSVALLGLLTGTGCLFVVYHSKDLKALDTIDFWVGTFLIFVMASVIIVSFGWILGLKKGWVEAHKGAELRIPGFFKLIIKYLSPLYLLTIFVFWVLFNVLGWDYTTGKFTPAAYVLDLVGPEPNTVARLSLCWVAVVIVFFMILSATAGRRWDNQAGKRTVPTPANPLPEEPR